jgi:hypothetical protein
MVLHSVKGLSGIFSVPESFVKWFAFSLAGREDMHKFQLCLSHKRSTLMPWTDPHKLFFKHGILKL